MTELKLCPFCGLGRPTWIEETNEDGDKFIAVECQGCFARTDGYYDKDDATRAWNRRFDDV